MKDNPVVAGVVVLYNPTSEVVANVDSYLGQVRRVYLIDNSTSIDPEVLQSLEALRNVVYIDNRGNKGIAHALNRGAELAIADGHRYALTMDQDTALTPGFVDTLTEGFRSLSDEKLGIMTPRYTKEHNANQRYQNVLVAMTSGNLLDLSVYQKAGPFMEQLFIDHVDHEYCIRLKSLGYYVSQDNQLVIHHKPGRRVQFSSGAKSVGFSSQTVTRLYYFCRNGFYVSAMYRKSVPEFRSLFMSLLTKTILKTFLEPDTISRWKMLRKGYRDYRSGQMGELK